MDTSSADRALRIAQLIIGAMAAGVLALCGVAVAVRQSSAPIADPQTTTVLLVVLGASVVMGLPGQFLLSQMVRRKARQQLARYEGDRAVAAATVFVAHSVIRGAIAESFGILGGVVLLATGQMLALVAPALSLLLILWLFPTRGRYDDFVTDLTGESWGRGG